ncbi:lipid A biosynthesis acyltransferase [Flammeovirgaceae bacterium SG7u.111]|nr:lipid A biosynthesis acyltransferase [Flammeovirgaceae bacterium SG7u.132]WPO36165.1 lipid A biosynthesis acyltransferase [Flammeovirgaceae bacterium SG7u.111]
MPKWKGKTRGGLLGYKIFIFILKSLGIKPAYFVLRFVIFYYIFFAPKASLSIYRYFRTAHKASPLKAFFSIFKNYFILGQILIDKIALISRVETSFSFTFTGEEHLVEMKNLNKGGFLISAHVGNWEVAGHYLKRLDTKVNIVMFEAEHEKIKDLLGEVMGEKKWQVIPIKNDLSHIFLINSALARNELICIHGDRFVEGAKAQSKEFFGNDAFFPIGPFTMAAKLRVPYSFVYCVKKTPDHYQLYATPLENTEKSVSEIMDDYVIRLEEVVKQYPEQWFNYYDFWAQENTPSGKR